MLAPHIGMGSRIIADEDGPQPRHRAAFAQGIDTFGEFGLDLGRRRLTVKNSSSHIGSLSRSANPATIGTRIECAKTYRASLATGSEVFMVNRAQLTQARSRQRRDALLGAAIELFADGGTRAITHRAVAKQAGLPPATTTYYFASIEDLIHEALSEHMRQWIETLRGLTDIDLSADLDLDEATRFVEYIFGRRDAQTAGLEVSIFLAAARDEQLSDIAGEALDALENLASGVLRAVGIADPQQLAASVITLIAGAAVRRQSPRVDETVEARMLAVAIRDLVAAHQVPETYKADALGKLAEGSTSQ